MRISRAIASLILMALFGAGPRGLYADVRLPGARSSAGSIEVAVVRPAGSVAIGGARRTSAASDAAQRWTPMPTCAGAAAPAPTLGAGCVFPHAAPPDAILRAPACGRAPPSLSLS